ncbi:MAG: chitin deacetylase family protein [Cyanobacteria bacterium J06623_5]
MTTRFSSSPPRQNRPKGPYRALASVLISLMGLGYLLSQPRWMFSLATRLWPGAHYAANLPTSEADSNRSDNHSDDRSKIVALSIDDGPSPATESILTTLNRHNAKATFFNISGNLPDYEDTVRQSLAAGHEFGNHLTADEPSIRLSAEAFEADLLTAEEAISSLLPNNDPAEPSDLVWLRPGMGFYNPQMVRTARSHGYQLVLGSVFPYDTHVPSSRFATAFILRTIQPGDIIVLHDGETRGARTAATLERVLPVLQARGYQVTTISELFEKLPDSNMALNIP